MAATSPPHLQSMVHVTAAIGLAIAFLLETMFWSVAPTGAAILIGGFLLGAIVWALARGGRRRP